MVKNEFIAAIKDTEACADVSKKHRDARKGHNPATGEAITIEARDGVPYAKFSSVAKA